MLVPAVEYLMYVSPLSGSGFSARDLESGWSLASPLEQALRPFDVPSGAPEEVVARRLFYRFRGIKVLFDDWVRNKDARVEELVNARRVLRSWRVGDLVYRKKPSAARQPRGGLWSVTEGPFVVVEVLTPQAVRLPAELLERIDRYAARLEAELHLSVSRSDALRRLLSLALEDAEDTAEAEAILRTHESRVSWEELKAGWISPDQEQGS